MALSLTCHILAIFVANSRVHMNAHSILQVTVGGIFGILFSLVWFAFGSVFLRKLYPSIVKHKLARFLLVRDSGPIDNVLYFEYEQHIKASSAIKSNQKREKNDK